VKAQTKYWLSMAVVAFVPLSLVLKCGMHGLFDGPRGD
jgi:hypothetical protein